MKGKQENQNNLLARILSSENAMLNIINGPLTNKYCALYQFIFKHLRAQTSD
jgi:hypothetical protein